MALIKQGQQLVDVSGEELTKQTGFTPLSPAAAKAQGANPDQAKMANTPAGKQGLYKAPVDAGQPTLQQSLQKQQGALPTGKEYQQQAQQAAAKMDRIKQLGTMGSQIEGLIQQKLASAQAIVPPAISQTAVATLPEEKRVQASQIMQAYLAATTPADKQTQQAALSTLLGSNVNIDTYIQQAPELLQAASKQALGTSMTLGQLAPAWLNAEQTAADLGISVEQLNNMSPEQLQEQLAATEANEYSRIEGLKAQMRTATGSAREALRQELRSMGQAGLTGTEEQFDRLQQSIDEGATITINGTDYSVEEALSDNRISDLISNATTNPAALQQLKDNPMYAGVAEWIESNKTALTELVTGVRQDVRAFGTVQTDLAGMKAELGKLSDLVVGELPAYATQADIDAAKAKMESSGLYQAAKADPAFKAELDLMKPETLAAMKDLTTEQIDGLKATNELIKNNGGIAAEFNLTPSEFVTDPTKAAKFEATVAALETASEEVDDQQKLDIAKAVAAGDLTPEIVSQMMQYPAEIADVMSETKLNKEYESIKGDFDKLSSFIFGETKREDINTTLQNLASIAPYDANAQRILNAFKSIVGADGMLDSSDMGRMQAALKSVGLEGVMKGGQTIQQKIAGISTQAKDIANYASTPAIDNIRAITGDNVVKFEELFDLDDNTLKLIKGNAYFKQHFPDAIKSIDNINKVNTVLGKGTPAALAVREHMQDGKIDSKEANKLAKKLDLDALDKLINSGLSFDKVTKQEPYKILGKTYYRDVTTDALANLKEVFKDKVDDTVKSYPLVKEGNRSIVDVQSLTKKMQQYAGGESYKEAFAVWDQINAQQPVLEASIASLKEQIKAASGAVKKALELKKKSYEDALSEVRWWASQPRTHKSGGSAALYNRIPTRDAYKGS
jgi:hypothetical protein